MILIILSIIFVSYFNYLVAKGVVKEFFDEMYPKRWSTTTAIFFAIPPFAIAACLLAMIGFMIVIAIMHMASNDSGSYF